jgi:tRNA(Ile)-lysidine synthase
MPHKIILATLQFIRTHKKEAKPLLLAFSGGPDSLALFHALLACRVDFHAAHIDHGWRVESARQAVDLQVLSAQHKIPFHLHTLAMSPDLPNIEELAREKRYGFLCEKAREIDAQAILLGHQADDQAETLLKRIFEGAPLDKLHGILPVTQREGIQLWRPLLSIPKKEIELFLNDIGASPIIDSTNFDPKYLRSRMRINLIPQLSREFGKQIALPLTHLAEEAGELDQFLSERIQSGWQCYQSSIKSGEINFNGVKLHLFEWKYLLRQVANERALSLGRDVVRELALLLEAGSSGIKKFAVSGEIWTYHNRWLRFEPQIVT